MERIQSRKNEKIIHLRKLGADRQYRYATGEFLCDGAKLLEEAMKNGAQVRMVLVAEGTPAPSLSQNVPIFAVPRSLLEAVSPLKTPQDILFSCKMPALVSLPQGGRTLILETVQDPGNLGTILRTANAFAIDCVCLTGACADLYNPKTVRATMGAVFRQKVAVMTLAEIAREKEKGLRLLGTALHADSTDLIQTSLENAAVFIGSEGSGLSEGALALCDGLVQIPMSPFCESLNAGVAASVIMWEMFRRGRENV